MDLKQKGDSAAIGTFKQLLVKMSWTTAADFDLAAMYLEKGKAQGQEGLVYFGDLGNLNALPFMQLSGDEGVGDAGGDNEEEMRIARFDDMAYVWILCWDYTKVQVGQPARFKGSDVKLTVADDQGNTHNMVLDTGDLGNVALMATIDNTGPVPKLTNTSKAGTLKGLTSTNQLMAIIEQ